MVVILGMNEFACDEYEQMLDDLLLGLALCTGVDCREPRRGAFVIWQGWDGDEPPQMLCVRCFLSDTMNIDPNEVGCLD